MMNQKPQLQVTSLKEINLFAKKRIESQTPSPKRSNLKLYQKQKYLPLIILNTKLILTPQYYSLRNIDYKFKIRVEDLKMKLVPMKRHSQSFKQVQFEQSQKNYLKHDEIIENQMGTREIDKQRNVKFVRDFYLEYLRDNIRDKNIDTMKKENNMKKQKKQVTVCKCQIM